MRNTERDPTLAVTVKRAGHSRTPQTMCFAPQRSCPPARPADAHLRDGVEKDLRQRSGEPRETAEWCTPTVRATPRRDRPKAELPRACDIDVVLARSLKARPCARCECPRLRGPQ